jgi:hypothetical protein
MTYNAQQQTLAISFSVEQNVIWSGVVPISAPDKCFSAPTLSGVEVCFDFYALAQSNGFSACLNMDWNVLGRVYEFPVGCVQFPQ